jgi:hypothetical protein
MKKLSRDQGALDAPMLSQGTNQARLADRVSARPAKAGEGGPGLATTHGGTGRVMTKRGATLNERTRTYSRQTQRLALPLRSP